MTEDMGGRCYEGCTSRVTEDMGVTGHEDCLRAREDTGMRTEDIGAKGHEGHTSGVTEDMGARGPEDGGLEDGEVFFHLKIRSFPLERQRIWD